MHFDSISQKLYFNSNPAAVGVDCRDDFWGKIGYFFGRSVKQTLLFADGTQKTLFLSKQSLARYIFLSAKSHKHPPEKTVSAYFVSHIAETLGELETAVPEVATEFANRVNRLVTTCLKTNFKGFLYKVKQHGEVKGYLLGTAHCGTKEMAALNYKIKNALLKSKTLFIEHRLNIIEQIQLNFKIPVKLINQICEITKMFESFGAYLKYGNEEILQSVCKKCSIPCNSLETFDEQIRVLSGFAMMCDNDTMTLAEKEQLAKEMLRGMKEGDWAPIVSSIELSDKLVAKNEQLKGVWEAFLGSRNRTMSTRAAALFGQATTKQRVMIAVGAIHLPTTDRGIITALQDRGFTVTRVR